MGNEPAITVDKIHFPRRILGGDFVRLNKLYFITGFGSKLKIGFETIWIILITTSNSVGLYLSVMLLVFEDMERTQLWEGKRRKTSHNTVRKQQVEDEQQQLESVSVCNYRLYGTAIIFIIKSFSLSHMLHNLFGNYFGPFPFTGQRFYQPDLIKRLSSSCINWLED